MKLVKPKYEVICTGTLGLMGVNDGPCRGCRNILYSPLSRLNLLPLIFFITAAYRGLCAYDLLTV